MNKEIEDFQKAQRARVLGSYTVTPDLISKAEEEEKKKEGETDDEFSHHRLMAGYHSMKADEIEKEALHLSSASNADLHGVAKEKKGEAARHKKAADEHREKAKGLFNQETHGNWNDTIPQAAEALKYGSKQAKEADKKSDEIEKEEDVIKDAPKAKEEVEKSEDIEKSKKGSHWLKGKKIGVTLSGKDIMNHKDHQAHNQYHKQDHLDAAETHDKLHDEVTKQWAEVQKTSSADSQESKDLSNTATHHRQQAAEHKQAAMKIQDTIDKIQDPSKKKGLQKAFETLGIDLIEKGGVGSGRHKEGEEVMYEGKKYKAGKHDPSTNLRYLHDTNTNKHAEDHKGDKLQVHESRVKKVEKEESNNGKSDQKTDLHIDKRQAMADMLAKEKKK